MRRERNQFIYSGAYGCAELQTEILEDAVAQLQQSQLNFYAVHSCEARVGEVITTLSKYL